MAGQRIGDMNGPWAAMLRIALAAMPVFISITIGFFAYLTRQSFAHETRLATIEHVEEIRAATLERLESKMDRLTEAVLKNGH